MRRFWLILLLVIACVAVASVAAARVGGGDSFGGGGSSGGGGGGDGEILLWLIYLAIRYPHLGVPALIIFGIVWFIKKRHRDKHALPASTAQSLANMRSGAVARKRVKVQSEIEKLLEDDPNFSETLFLDFAQMIYTRFQEGRGRKNIEGLSFYLSEELIERLKRIGTQLGQTRFEVERVVVGSVSIEHITSQGSEWRIVCDMEANYTERTETPEGKPRKQAYYARSRLNFRRLRGVLSKGPESIRSLGCPSCGSPIKLDAENLCAYCGQPADSGIFHWALNDLEETVRMRRREAPLALGGVEVGTDFPTVFDPNLDVAVKAFGLRYPGETVTHLQTRAEFIFVTLQQAWTSGKWEQARAFETDRLFQMHTFWMDRYRSKGYRNVLEQVQVQGTTLVKLSRDAFFETATLRIKASMIDYTQDKQGKLVGGSKSKARVFTEYWTLVRKAGFEPGKDAEAGSCPSCGAPVKVAMNGRCDYCDANLASGDFDWTLAKIEQDEAYAG